jgi:hypothetical protein
MDEPKGMPTGAAASELPRAYGGPVLHAMMRALVEDFRVEEILGYNADGHGEHALLWVEKRDANTDWVARELAKFAGVPPTATTSAGCAPPDARQTSRAPAPRCHRRGQSVARQNNSVPRG